MRIDLEGISKATGGALIKGAPGESVTGVATDSRKVSKGEVFFALKGPNFDGHRFVRDAAVKGAAAAVVECAGGAEAPHSFGVIEVKDTLKALGDLARHIRVLHKIPVIGISGSAGKTTTKEMTASILGRSREVLKTEGNLNNLIGLPLTLFGLDERHRAAVVELGISETWEMERLVDISRPDIAVITNIGRGHLKTLGSLEGVARAKGPLFTAIKKDGVRVVNLDDPWVVRIAASAPGERVTYSLRERADVTVKSYGASGGLSGMEAEYGVRGKSLRVRINSAGVTNVVNGAAAIAATLPLGANLNDIKDGLFSYLPVHGRMEVVKVNGLTLLDDSYNANPESVSAALRTLKEASGRKVAVLGDMLELGEASEEEHRSVGRLVSSLGIDILVAVGVSARGIAEGAASSGMGADNFYFKEKKEALASLRSILREGDSVLIKGSRAAALEEIVEGLKGFGPFDKAC